MASVFRKIVIGRRRIDALVTPHVIGIMYPGVRLGAKVRFASSNRVQCTDGGGVAFGDGVTISRFSSIVVRGGQISLGENTVIREFVTIVAIDKIIIGDDCLIAEGVTIRDQNHGMKADSPYRSQPQTSLPVIIGDNVWVGAKATILPGAVIGTGAVIGANAVVTGKVDAYTVVAGVPARVIRKVV